MQDFQFLFDGTFYRQVDGVAMGRPLVPMLAGISMGNLELKAYQQIERIASYRRYFDEVIIISESASQYDVLFDFLNSLHESSNFQSKWKVMECYRSWMSYCTDKMMENYPTVSITKDPGQANTHISRLLILSLTNED